MPRPRVCVLAALAAAVAGCGDPGNALAPPAGSTGQLLVIRNHLFDPPSLAVVPGSTVLIQNQDRLRHTVTSEGARDALTLGVVANGVLFDTGPIPPASAVEIPAGVPPGTVLPFFCTLHGDPAEQGELVVVAP